MVEEKGNKTINKMSRVKLAAGLGAESVLAWMGYGRLNNPAHPRDSPILVLDCECFFIWKKGFAGRSHFRRDDPG